MIKKAIIFFILLTLLSCKQENNVGLELKIGDFSLHYPSHWKLVEPKTIDSYYSYLTNTKDTLFIHNGMYNSKIYKDSLFNNKFSQIQISDKQAVLEIPKNDIGFYSLYLPKYKSNYTFHIFSNATKRNQEIENIIRSVRLMNSHQIPNFNDIKFVDNKIGTGITNYENNCLNCHSEYRYEIAVPLDSNFIKSKDKNWLKKYLYSQKKNESEYNIKCFQFERKDSMIVKEIVEYLQQNQ